MIYCAPLFCSGGQDFVSRLFPYMLPMAVDALVAIT
jgi:hypothetical protein